ncbi:hypothetical protein [Nocardia bovistercoris]|uniref:Uncharacterized protein n=1 Tax=Nocardia bovistercoris TaxID=2785916 RepID=A0A931I8X7_9NOCA|nr:hypothetical protein [Nocardia bovistercoris]MBH0776486.1 hypothetical protein [Nocardia bovistercoris]
MAEFTIIDIFPVSFMPEPFIVGHIKGEMNVGEAVELRKSDGSRFTGAVKALDFHRSGPDRYSIVFSGEISPHAEKGDLIVSLDN